jgi:predicted ester cyclase
MPALLICTRELVAERAQSETLRKDPPRLHQILIQGIMRAAPDGGRSMTASHIETVRAYWAASDGADWEAAGRCTGDGFTWVDHTYGDAPMEGRLAVEEAQAWSDQTFAINQWYEATDGTLIVQATVTRTLTGKWRGVEPRGQRVTNAICDIFRFNEDGLIVHEELYEDALAVMRQLRAAS